MSPLVLVDIPCYNGTFEPTSTGVLEAEMVIQPSSSINITLQNLVLTTRIL